MNMKENKIARRGIDTECMKKKYSEIYEESISILSITYKRN